MNIHYRYHHFGIPTDKIREDMVFIEHLKIYASNHESNPFGIQWMKYEEGCNIPELVKSVTHLAFEVDNLKEALKGKNIIIEPNSPSPGVVVAFIEEDGLPIELLQYTEDK